MAQNANALTSVTPFFPDEKEHRRQLANWIRNAHEGRQLYILSASGAVATTIWRKLGEVVSVTDFGAKGDASATAQTALTAALSRCFSTGEFLYWPDGTYLSTASLAHLHAVRHLGPGAIKRGTLTFYVEPHESQANTIHVATSGLSANDGLSSAEPLLTFQNAFDALSNYGPLLDGFWTIRHASGTAQVSTQQTFNTPSINRVVIKGPSVGGTPNVPVMVIDGSSSAADYTHGMSITGNGVYATVQDMKFQNFTGDPSGSTRGGLVIDGGADVYCNNVHATQCTWFGVYYTGSSQGRHQGGIITNCRNGINTDNARVTVGYGATSVGDSVAIGSCTESGVYWSRSTQGHCDYVSFTDNAVGLVLGEGSRVDAVGADFKRNTVGVRAQTLGQFGNNPGTPCVFNIGTVDANTTAFEYKAYSGETDELHTSKSYHNVATDRTAHRLSGTGLTTLSTPFTLIPGRLQGTNKACKVQVYGVWETATAATSIGINFGSLTLTLAVPGAATNVTFMMEAELCEVAGGYRCFGRLTQGVNQSRLGMATTGFNNSGSQTISVALSLASTIDQAAIYRVDVSLMG